MITISTFTLGPLENNSYLISEKATGESAIVDPSFESQILIDEISRDNLIIKFILITHAHFDHLAGVHSILKALPSAPMIALHPGDLSLWNIQGDADKFGIKIDPLPKPQLSLEDNQVIKLGNSSIKVMHTPGHTPGHVVYRVDDANSVMTGDLIFYHSIGRTDLPGGNQTQLIESINRCILTLPPATRLLSGHGHETSVSEEATSNPFLSK